MAEDPNNPFWFPQFAGYYEPIIAPGTTLQYWRGDKTWQTLDTSVVPENTNLYFTNARAIASTLTGYVSGAGTITAADTILEAIQKLNGNMSAGYVPYSGASSNVDLGTYTLTTPTVTGGSAVGSQLNLKGTSGNGTSTVAAINFLAGNNGATTAGSIYNSGQVNIGNYASPTNLRIFTVGQDTAFVSIGSLVGATSYGALYFDQTSPSVSNYALIGSGSETMLNATTNLYLRINNTSQLAFTTSTAIFSPSATSSGATTSFTFTGSANTGQTASTAIPKVLYTLGSTQWATGALASTQKFFSITQPTISFVGASAATLVATVGIAGAPIQGTNATNTTSVGLLIEAGAITGATTSYGAYFNAQTGGSTNYALGLAGDLRFPTGNATISGSNALTIQSSSGSNVVLNAGSTTQTYVIFSGQGTTRFSLTTGTNTSAAVSYAVYSPASNTGQTASTEINGYLHNSYTRTWANGGAATTITTQREHYIKTVTWATSGGGSLTVTNGYAFYIEAPTASGIIITNNYALGLNGSLKINDAFNIVFDTTTGTKIGTGTAQKIGFWNATPIVQPTTAVTAATFVANTSGIVDDTATFDGYTIGQVVKALRDTGILA